MRVILFYFIFQFFQLRRVLELDRIALVVGGNNFHAQVGTEIIMLVVKVVRMEKKRGLYDFSLEKIRVVANFSELHH